MAGFPYPARASLIFMGALIGIMMQHYWELEKPRYRPYLLGVFYNCLNYW